jgi:cytochrome c-type biogenesis protein
MSEVSFPLAFAAGLLSFLSPCVLPLVPSYVSFITGISFEKLTQRQQGLRTFTLKSSLAFVAGFSAVFIGLGASASQVGRWLLQFQDFIRIAGGVLVILFGLFIAGLLPLRFLSKEHKLHLRARPAGYVGAFLVGMTFAAGWTPCIGPILGSILTVAASQASVAYGVKLLGVYSLGLALPFVLSALAINTFLAYSRVAYRFMRPIMLLSGLLLIAFGLLLLTNKLQALVAIFPGLEIGL